MNSLHPCIYHLSGLDVGTKKESEQSFPINTGSLVSGDLDYTEQFDLVVYLHFKTSPQHL